MRAKHPQGFLNVDLEIVSRSNLDLLEAGLSKVAYALYSAPIRKGIYLLSLECNRYPRDADAGIRALADAVDQLGRAERRLWDRALSRKFDVGYTIDTGDTGIRLVQVALRPETLKRVVALRATVAFSCYQELAANQPATAAQPRD